MNKQQTIAVTGASGFVGEIVCQGLKKAGYRVVEYDCYGGWLYRLLNRNLFMPAPVPELTDEKRSRWSRKVEGLSRRLRNKLVRMGLLKEKPFMSVSGSSKIRFSLWMRKRQRCLLKLMLSIGFVKKRSIDILDRQSQWVSRFKGIHAVIHLAAIPHPNVPGMTETDFELVNYWGSRNIFEAAKQAGVEKFIFASSGQVYDINNYKDWVEFPVCEEVAASVQSGASVHPYSRLKWEVEQFLANSSSGASMVSIALRLEYPGIFGGGAGNLWILTSVENLQDAFNKSVSADLPAGFYSFNICDEEVPFQLGDVEAGVAEKFPQVPRKQSGNKSLWSVDSAKKLIGYNPQKQGTYFHSRSVFG